LGRAKFLRFGFTQSKTSKTELFIILVQNLEIPSCIRNSHFKATINTNQTKLIQLKLYKDHPKLSCQTNIVRNQNEWGQKNQGIVTTYIWKYHVSL